ncbi:hypothetical protein PTSG_03286 [Salpingoeca rosetta]|uniref:MI domain-containing protein n=1 Tax=Salpingoeca rosetta (strain ATCC 50818 / BSB-021) TaxID=946362 RepID=F2U4R3_SALR5|nr:uncharacterized protein PTSG_03286 [Salpingoeca rosetta]EGD82629.1 hypothetical protein PTSG_03286 [Salpingoeca rosetta]|eukprot:XP_004995865.1 hypothetical protein PTSG_03286 [Salpingoeca rosetta]
MSFEFVSVPAFATRQPRGRARKCRPRKQGAGRGGWGRLDDFDMQPLPIDQEDPIYDATNDDDDGSTEWVESYPTFDEKTIVRMLRGFMQELFSHGDVTETLRACERVNWPESKHIVVQTIIPFSFSFKDAERELTSTVLAYFVQQQFLSTGDVERGFNALLEQLPSLLLDAPKASEYLYKFITRAVSHGCVSHTFVFQHPLTSQDGPQADVLHRAQAMLTAPHNKILIDKIWGDHAEFRDLGFAKSRIHTLLQELLVSSDVSEACRCIHDLSEPHFVHEVVYQAVYLAMECGMQPRVLDLVCELLSRMSTSGLCSSDQMTMGFRRVYNALDDILIDLPHGYRHLAYVVDACYNRDAITATCVQELPQRPYRRRREISEAESEMSMDTDEW